MRVIAGSAKGRRLIGPKSDRIRPALDKVKEAIFNILGDIDHLRVLDLFAGTGSIGIEALSRGAGHVVLADSGPEALQIIRKNLEICRFSNKASILKVRLPADISRIAKKQAPFDLIFVDPPYDRNLVGPTLRKIAEEKILAPRGTAVVEHSPREEIREECGLVLTDQRRYGQTRISFLRRRGRNQCPTGP